MFKQNTIPKSKGKWRKLRKIRNGHSFKRLKENGDTGGGMEMEGSEKNIAQ